MNAFKETFQRLLIIGLIILPGSIFAGIEELSPEVRVEEFSLSREALALNGYDPVAYFNGGPKKGSKQLSYTFKGVTYRFASEENRKQFIDDPFKFEPQYGGWCAWAMSDGGKRTEANPESFKIINGKLYVFYDGFFGDTLALWNAVEDDKKLIGQADRYWADQVLK